MILTNEDRQARLERLNALEQRKDRLEQLLADAVRKQNPEEQYLLPSNHADLPLREVPTFRAQRSGFAHFNPQQANIKPQQEFRHVDLESIRSKLDEEVPQPPQAPTLQTQESNAAEAPKTVAEVEVPAKMGESSGAEDAPEVVSEATDPAPETVEDSEVEDLTIPMESETPQTSEES